MIKRMPTHSGDETCPACVIGGDFIFPARMTTTTEFLDAACLCMLDGIGYKQGINSDE